MNNNHVGNFSLTIYTNSFPRGRTYACTGFISNYTAITRRTRSEDNIRLQIFRRNSWRDFRTIITSPPPAPNSRPSFHTHDSLPLSIIHVFPINKGKQTRCWTWTARCLIFQLNNPIIMCSLSSQEKPWTRREELAPPMSKYFVVASLDRTSFLVYPDSR